MEELSFWEYHRKVFSRSAKKVLRLVEYTSFGLVVILGIVSLVCPKLGGVMNPLLWAIPLAVFIGTGFIEFMLCSYLLYKDVERERNHLIERAKPRLAVLREKTENIDFSATGRELSLGLEIKNLGTDQAKNCQGILVDICFAGQRNNNFGLDTQPKNRPLMWTSENRNASTGYTTIEGNTPAILEIATCRLNSGLFLSYAGDKDTRDKLEIKLPYGILAIISVTSEGAVPIYAVCFFKREWWYYKIELVDTLNTKPDINHYRSLIDNREGSQT